MITTAIACIAFAAWIYLLCARGGFWRADIRGDQDIAPDPSEWPSVAVIIPARNEADVIAATLTSHLNQNYPAAFQIILVDDQSDDDTADVAAAAAAKGTPNRLQIVSGTSLPPGWTGKLWAVKQGIEQAASLPQRPRYLLLTDADISYSPNALKELVARAEARNLVLTSLMVKLRCESFAERAFIPAFVFFFQMLYPFAWVNAKDKKMAAAAGGCMLVRLDALRASGGIESIRASLIDDCALGRQMKRIGPIWLGLTESVRSLRPYPGLADIRKMVARSAYDQLNYSPFLLAATVIAMTITYLIPPALALFGNGTAEMLGAASWALMTFAFFPIVRFYSLSPLWAAALPLISGAYMFFTLDSAYQHWRGKGGFWKGRVQAQRAAP